MVMAGNYEQIAELRARADGLRGYAASLESQAYMLEADAYDAEGYHVQADYYRALARGDGQRGYIRLRALQFIERGEHYSGDNAEQRAEIAAEVERIKASQASPGPSTSEDPNPGAPQQQ
jgi:hypothetical protein